MMTKSFWSEPLERWNNHKAQIKKAEVKTCLQKQCGFRSSDQTDFPALIINSVGDVEYEAGYLHLELKRVWIKDINLGLNSTCLDHDPAISLDNITEE